MTGRTYRYHTKPYQHQVKALKQLLRQGYGGALIMEPRTGKSKVATDWLSVLNMRKDIDRAVIICPNRVMGTWVNELLLHSPRRLHITVWDKDERKKGIPAKPPGYHMHVLIINFDAFATPGKKLPSGRRSKASGRFKLRANLLKWMDGKPTACVVDESHKLKSPSGKASNMIVGMQDKFKYRAILTGTPMTKAHRAFDIYMQWNFLQPERFADLPTVAEFRDRYGRWTIKNNYPQFLGPKNLGELHRRMNKDAFTIRRDQCYDLPPREDIVQFVKMTDKTRSIYEKMAEEMIAEIEEGRFAEASINLVKTLRLGQITSGFVTDVDGEITRFSFEKLDALREIYEQQFDLEQKVVVAARWRPDLDLIADEARNMDVPVWSIRGGVSRADSDAAVHEFREHKGAGVIVVQPSASSLGIDLSTAAHMVWYSHTPSWVDFTQCCDRIALSRSSTTFTHLVARRSVDEVLLNTLATDGDVARAIMSRPGELINGHPLDLDDNSRFSGLGTFQYSDKKGKK